MRLAEVDSERATSAINPTGASREGSGWSGPSKLFATLLELTSGSADKPTNEVDGAFKVLSAGSGGERSANFRWWVSWVSGDEPCGSVDESTIAFVGGMPL